MNQQPVKVFRVGEPTAKCAYQDAIAEIIGNIQGTRTDEELARMLGCSGPTISLARRKMTMLGGDTLARIAQKFGPASLNPFLRLGGGRAVPLSPDETRIPELVDCSHTLVATYIGAVHPDSPGGSRIVHTELAQIKSHAPRMAALAAGVGG